MSGETAQTGVAHVRRSAEGVDYADNSTEGVCHGPSTPSAPATRGCVRAGAHHLRAGRRGSARAGRCHESACTGFSADVVAQLGGRSGRHVRQRHLHRARSGERRPLRRGRGRRHPDRDRRLRRGGCEAVDEDIRRDEPCRDRRRRRGRHRRRPQRQCGRPRDPAEHHDEHGLDGAQVRSRRHPAVAQDDQRQRQPRQRSCRRPCHRREGRHLRRRTARCPRPRERCRPRQALVRGQGRLETLHRRAGPPRRRVRGDRPGRRRASVRRRRSRLAPTAPRTACSPASARPASGCGRERGAAAPEAATTSRIWR